MDNGGRGGGGRVSDIIHGLKGVQDHSHQISTNSLKIIEFHQADLNFKTLLEKLNIPEI